MVKKKNYHVNNQTITWIYGVWRLFLVCSLIRYKQSKLDLQSITLKDAKRWGTKNGMYEIYKDIGESTFGTVLQAKRGKFGPLVAVTLLQTKRTGQIKLALFEILKQLSHENIVDVIDFYYCFDPPGSSMKKMATPVAVGLVMKYCLTRDLARYLQSYTVSETTRLRWYQELVSGLQFLHERNIYHGDINPQNVWIQDDKLKLGYGGIACIAWDAHSPGSTFGKFISNFNCSAPFIPPEAWNGVYVEKSDVFSLAMLFLVIAEAPDKGHHYGIWNEERIHLGKLLHEITPSQTVTPTHLIFPPIMKSSPQEVKLLDKMLQYSYQERPDTASLLIELKQLQSKSGQYFGSDWVKWCAC